MEARAGLGTTYERRGVLTVDADAPRGVVGTDWSPMMTVRAGDTEDIDSWAFRGEASVVEAPYVVADMYGEYEETIAEGAFAKTLSERPDVALVYMHDFAATMATTRSHTLTLRADPNLTTEASLAKSDLDVQRVVPKIQRGDANAMSFRFRVVRQEWDEDYEHRRILEVSLQRGDVSILPTGLGANPQAWGDLRSLELDAVLDYLGDPIAGPERRAAVDAALHSENVPAPDEVRAFLAKLVVARERARHDTLV